MAKNSGSAAKKGLNALLPANRHVVIRNGRQVALATEDPEMWIYDQLQHGVRAADAPIDSSGKNYVKTAMNEEVFFNNQDAYAAARKRNLLFKRTTGKKLGYLSADLTCAYTRDKAGNKTTTVKPDADDVCVEQFGEDWINPGDYAIKMMKKGDFDLITSRVGPYFTDLEKKGGYKPKFGVVCGTFKNDLRFRHYQKLVAAGHKVSLFVDFADLQGSCKTGDGTPGIDMRKTMSVNDTLNGRDFVESYKHLNNGVDVGNMPIYKYIATQLLNIWNDAKERDIPFHGYTFDHEHCQQSDDVSKVGYLDLFTEVRRLMPEIHMTWTMNSEMQYSPGNAWILNNCGHIFDSIDFWIYKSPGAFEPHMKMLTSWQNKIGLPGAEKYDGVEQPWRTGAARNVTNGINSKTWNMFRAEEAMTGLSYKYDARNGMNKMFRMAPEKANLAWIGPNMEHINPPSKVNHLQIQIDHPDYYKKLTEDEKKKKQDGLRKQQDEILVRINKDGRANCVDDGSKRKCRSQGSAVFVSGLMGLKNRMGDYFSTPQVVAKTDKLPDSWNWKFDAMPGYQTYVGNNALNDGLPVVASMGRFQNGYGSSDPDSVRYVPEYDTGAAVLAHPDTDKYPEPKSMPEWISELKRVAGDWGLGGTSFWQYPQTLIQDSSFAVRSAQGKNWCPWHWGKPFFQGKTGDVFRGETVSQTLKIGGINKQFNVTNPKPKEGDPIGFCCTSEVRKDDNGNEFCIHYNHPTNEVCGSETHPFPAARDQVVSRYKTNEDNGVGFCCPTPWVASKLCTDIDGFDENCFAKVKTVAKDADNAKHCRGAGGAFNFRTYFCDVPDDNWTPNTCKDDKHALWTNTYNKLQFPSITKISDAFYLY